MDRAARDDEKSPAGETAKPDPEWRNELEAMTAIGTAIEGLEGPARERVLAWTIARYGFKDR